MFLQYVPLIMFAFLAIMATTQKNYIKRVVIAIILCENKHAIPPSVINKELHLNLVQFFEQEESESGFSA